MEIFIKLICVSLLASVVYVIVRQYKSEYAVFVELAAVVITVSLFMNYALNAAVLAKNLMDLPTISTQSVEILIKSLVVAAAVSIVGDICRDNGSGALASSIEMCAKAMIISFAVPLIKSVMEIALGLING